MSSITAKKWKDFSDWAREELDAAFHANFITYAT